ncbi:MAG: serine hydrolase, partial [Geothrix sp.]|nr:serine hydrolase [Geothrix sp.]
SREVSSYPPNTPHFTFPSYAYRWNWLPKQKLRTPPGTAAAYSNIGFDLLGDALASASGSGNSYAHLLRQDLIEPLRMWDTTLAPSADQCARLLRSSRNEGPCTDTQPSGPSGGVYSTPADMAKFLQYVLHSPGSPAQPAGALDVYIRPKQLRSIEGLNHVGRATGIGLAWVQLGDPDSPSMVMEKTGGGAGFGTYIVVSPQHHTGIFLAITEGRGGATVNIYHEINTMLADLSGVPPLPPKAQLLRPAKRTPQARQSKLQPRTRNARPTQPKTRSAHPAKRTPKLHSAPPTKHAPKANPQKTKPRPKHPASAHPTPKRRRK